MLKDHRLSVLYLFFFINFTAVGMTTFAAKYYGEIGLTDGQIGLISAAAASTALFAQPVWGILADRARVMRSVLAAALAVTGLLCFFVVPFGARFAPLLAVLTLYSLFYLPAMPVGNAIAIEYTASRGHSFGPVRMMGTIGYQAGILLTGFLLTGSLRLLYPATGAALLLAAALALLLPPVRSQKQAAQKADIRVLFRDRQLLLLFSVAFLANIGHQFNLVFFSKHLGDLGISNTVAGLINTLSVMLEIPFLFFADRIMKRCSIWKWMTIGLTLGAVRYLLLTLVRAPVPLLLAQLLSIAQLSCFEFFPYVYLGRVVRKDLLASAQSVYQTVTFGIARIAASLLGGALGDAVGIPAVYGGITALMILTLAVFLVPLRRMDRANPPLTSAGAPS